VKVVHDFEFKRAAAVSFLNILGMVAIFGISALSYFMSSRVIRFGWEVLYEVITR
jgi:ABC-type phosphate transport system auxiliary subunit